MSREVLKQAFAAREAHEALLKLKKLVDEAATDTHQAELESFSVAVTRREDAGVRSMLKRVVERFKSPDFDAALAAVREKLQAAESA
jgi:hypothetical protein